MGRGTGLGLSMVYGAVRQNQGHVTVYSEPGMGSSFKIYLPRVHAEPEQAAPRAIDGDSRGTERVVLVEDDPMVRRFTAKVLTMQGYRVQAFEAAESAYAAVQADPAGIDLLLTDIVMPGDNGDVLARKLRIIKSDLKVLFTSGYSEDVMIQDGLLDGGAGFIGKPYSPRELVSRVREVLDA